MMDSTHEPIIEELYDKKVWDEIRQEILDRKPTEKSILNGKVTKKCLKCNEIYMVSKYQTTCPKVGCNNPIELCDPDIEHILETKLQEWKEELEWQDRLEKEYKK